ncbi:hypothetical protein PR202_ga05909 [Eleusine coracana subsp. coracana]|uniref:Isopenicillin N synthase-like Fe(2+) 2OG dioxygenase domain-containing protein n=1 Tax=Eleusine coracana subsp. coracana TaxID=191504 RepID=A0AAV5BW35_ELECO|nr:hypothetical protein PR202_ga05909 [Eleusine coracana subsp. coracana]
MEQPPSVRTVTIPFADLKERDKDLGGKIEEGLGPRGLGIISIADVPEFPELRKKLLRLAPRHVVVVLLIIAKLPEDVKKELEDPESRWYNFGWSHGKEKLESGKLDTFKGSFYANPVLDVPTTEDVLVSRYPSYCRPNIWPTDHLPELETVRPEFMAFLFLSSVAFKALGKLILEVGLMLAHHCDLYGLTCGLFTKNSLEIPCPDTAAGLYIQTRDNRVVKAVFEEDELAYQIGETTEILSGGHLCATPHCVQYKVN